MVREYEGIKVKGRWHRGMGKDRVHKERREEEGIVYVKEKE